LEQNFLHAVRVFFVNANSNGQKVCNGDSGGPAYVQEKLQELEASANSDNSEDFVTFLYLAKVGAIGHEMALSTFVANNSATYLGLSAMAFMGEKFVDCRRKETKNFAVGHWWLGAKVIGVGLKKISESPLEEKQAWLEKNFDCGDLKDFTSVRINFEVTNTQECPLNSQTVNSCYVFHGLVAYRVPLKGN
jgi:hypothetical protein